MSGSIFSLENEISSLTRMDLPLNVGSKGLQPRWQRKQQQQQGLNASGAATAGAASSLDAARGLNSSGILNNSNAGRLNSSLKLNSSGVTKFGGNLSLSTGGLGGIVVGGGTKRLSESLRKTPSKTPKKSPGRSWASSDSTTPGRKTPGGGDRFIPNRSGTDFEACNFRLLRGEMTDPEKESMSPSKREYQRLLAENLGGGCGGELEMTRIIAYSNKAPTAPESHSNGLKVLYSQSKSASSSAKKTARHIPQVPERILDAPEILNDYYLNLIDWSSNNHLAVALGAHIYLWNAGTGDIQQLMELEGSDDYVCSVRWIKEGNCLAVGNAQGEISLWDVEQMKRVRTMTGHTDRVGCLSWNQYILSSGSRSGKINHSDVRQACHLVGSAAAHSQEVCGLAWSPDGRMLASGGNDNVLNVWAAAQGQCFTEAAPKFTFTQHQAAVKAVSWCPWQPSVLASGGGTADRCIRLWNCNNGSLLNTIDTKSQVCALLWSSEYKELVSSHGFANNEVTIWKYPSMVKVAELLGHTERVLHLSLSPDGSTVVSAGADETLRLWKCFAPDQTKKKDCKTKSEASNLIGRGGIR